MSKAREELQEILNNKEYTIYQNDSKGLFEMLWEKAREWITKKLIKLFPSLESTADNLSGPVLIVIIVAVIIILALIMFFLFRNRIRERNLKKQKPLQSMDEINWSYQRHLTEAKKQEEKGLYEQATRHLFLALLLYFHEKKWLEARIWKTNWEYYDELRRFNEDCAKDFFELAAIFDDVTYGEHSILEEGYQRFYSVVMKWMDDEHGNERLGERG